MRTCVRACVRACVCVCFPETSSHIRGNPHFDSIPLYMVGITSLLLFVAADHSKGGKYNKC